MLNRHAIILLWVLFAGASRADAVGLGNPDDLLSVEAHGFVSQGFIGTTSNNYLAEHTTRGSFEFTEMGLNVTKALTDKLRVGAQVFSHKIGPLGNFDPKLDWAYIDYRWQDWLGFRGGRVKLPFGLYNEVNDVDSARTPILLPQSVYPLANRDFLLAQTGAEVYGYVDLASRGALDYHIYGGKIYLDLETDQTTPRVENVDIPYVAGGRLLWETPIRGLRVGGSLQYLRLDADLVFDRSLYGPLQRAGQLPPEFRGRVSLQVPALLWVSSVEYTIHDWLLAAEYSRWSSDTKSTQPVLVPERSTTSERAYAMATYRVNSWFQPGFYYSILFPDVDDRSGRAAVQHDLAGMLRFDINSYFLIKVEGHYMNGTAGLSPGLNDNIPTSKLDRDWSVFLVKATFHF